MKKSRISGWFILTGGLIGGALFFFSLLLLWAIRPEGSVESRPTAILTIIAAPTQTSQPLPDLLSTPTPSPSAEVVIDGIGKGLYVQISGTGGSGLRLRTQASTTAEVRFLGYESEVFMVTNGPKNADGYVWWYLTAPYDEARSGWAASTFLKPVSLQP